MKEQEQKKTYKLENGFEIHWEDLEFLRHIREINYGEIEKVQIVNGRIQGFKKPKQNIKIF